MIIQWQLPCHFSSNVHSSNRNKSSAPTKSSKEAFGDSIPTTSTTNSECNSPFNIRLPKEGREYWHFGDPVLSHFEANWCAPITLNWLWKVEKVYYKGVTWTSLMLILFVFFGSSETRVLNRENHENKLSKILSICLSILIFLIMITLKQYMTVNMLVPTNLKINQLLPLKVR